MVSSKWDRIDAQFAAFDQDGNGYIDREDFRAAAQKLLAEFAIPAQSEKAKMLYDGADLFWYDMEEIADRDGDFRITRGEFMYHAVTRLRDNPNLFAAIAGPFLLGALDLVDHDGDGTATVVDTVRMLVCLGVQPDVAEAAAAALDTDGDGKVDEGEMLNALALYFTTV